MSTFHIRAPKPRKGAANRFYNAGEYRTPKTLCGAAVTSHDNSFRWQVEAIGSFEPCEACVLIRKEMRSKR